MPRTNALTRTGRYKQAREELADQCLIAMHRKGVKVKQVAEFVGISPQAVGQQLNHDAVSMDVFCAICYLADIPAYKIERMVKGSDY